MTLTPQEMSDLRGRVLAGDRITDIETCRAIVETLRGNRCTAAATSAEKKATGGGKRKKTLSNEALLADFDAFLPKAKE